MRYHLSQNHAAAASHHGTCRRWHVRSEVTAVAQVTIVHQYADGSATKLRVTLDEDYPDAVAEAVARVTDLWRETCTDQADS